MESVFYAKARRTMRESKRKSWKQYVSGLNSRTSIKNVWDMVRKMQGKGKSPSANHLKKNNTNVTSKKDILQILWRIIFRTIYLQKITLLNFKILKPNMKNRT